jgi:hypothetical protein
LLFFERERDLLFFERDFERERDLLFFERDFERERDLLFFEGRGNDGRLAGFL